MHTKGPWIVDGLKNRPPALIATDVAVICEFTNHPRIKRGDIVANAHLIAAAPDMLEALEIAKRAIGDCICHEIEASPRGWCTHCIIDCAIRKAKGE